MPLKRTPKLRPTLKRTALIAAVTFIRTRASPAKAAINSDPATAAKLTGEWSPCQESSALQWVAKSNYHLKAENLLKVRIAEAAESMHTLAEFASACSSGFPDPISAAVGRKADIGQTARDVGERPRNGHWVIRFAAMLHGSRWSATAR